LSFGGVMPPTPSFASLQYGLPYTMAGHNKQKKKKSRKEKLSYKRV